MDTQTKEQLRLQGILDNCQFQYDVVRGIVYVHNKDTGSTVLRIKGIPPDLRKNALDLCRFGYFGFLIDINLETEETEY